MKIFLLLFTSVLVLVTVSCSHKPDEKVSVQNLELDSKSQPSKIVGEFWDFAIKGDFESASKKIAPAPVSYLYWKPGQINSSAQPTKDEKKLFPVQKVRELEMLIHKCLSLNLQIY